MSLWAADYSCIVYNNTEKVTTLIGSLPENNNTNPNTALAFVLCQQAGLPSVRTQIGIPGLRHADNVTKVQELPNPACSLQCYPIA